MEQLKREVSWRLVSEVTAAYEWARSTACGLGWVRLLPLNLRHYQLRPFSFVVRHGYACSCTILQQSRPLSPLSCTFAQQARLAGLHVAFARAC